MVKLNVTVCDLLNHNGHLENYLVKEDALMKSLIKKQFSGTL